MTNCTTERPYTLRNAIDETIALARVTHETCYLIKDDMHFHFGSKDDMDCWYPAGWHHLFVASIEPPLEHDVNASFYRDATPEETTNFNAQLHNYNERQARVRRSCCTAPGDLTPLVARVYQAGDDDLLNRAIALIRATIDGGYVAAIVPQMRALIAAYDAQKGRSE